MAMVFVITGPSGVGKGTLIRGLRERMPELELSVSATTRKPRPGEREGVHYHFMTPEEFAGARRRRRLRRARQRTRGTATGRLAPSSRDMLAEGAGVVLEIEVQGARQVREAMPEAVAVFIAPPSETALRGAAVGRGTDSPEQVDQRLRTAERELEAQPEFAYVVVNDRLEDSTDELVEIVRSELPRE